MVVGNCQAQFVGHQLQALPLMDRFSVNHHFCDLPDHEIETGKRLISNAEIVLVQDIRDWERYPLKDYVQNTAQIIKFPCLRFASLWPFDSLNGPGDPEALNRDGPALKFPHLDGALARLRREIPDPELRLARYAALEMKLMVDPGRLHEFELQRLLAMDQKFQFEIGQFILDNFRHQRLFYATGHPRGKLFEMLLDRLFRSLEIKGFVPTGRELDRQLEGIEIPVHPMVGNILGVKWATERARYLYEGEQVTWEIYVRRYIDYYG